MTKHIVADGTLGQLSRKQWEIQRRVLEGTLNVQEVCTKLQRIIEGAPTSTFDVEQVYYTVGERTYPITTRVKKDFCVYAQELQKRGVFSKTFIESRMYPETHHYGELFSSTERNHKRKLRLVRVTKHCSKSVLVIQARQSNHILADPWDLIAFFEQSPFHEIVHPTMSVYALGGEPVQEWWSGENCSYPERREPCNVFVRGEERGWELNEEERKDNRHYSMDGKFFLIRDN